MAKKRYTKYITVGTDPVTGKRIRKHIYGNSPNDLQRNINAFLKGYEAQLVPSAPVLFLEYAQHWLETYKSIREAKTREMYACSLRKTEPIDYKPLTLVTSADIQKIINAHMHHPSACRKLAMCLRQIFKQAILDGIILQNPAKHIDLPKVPKTEARALLPEEKKAILSADLDQVERIYVSLLFYLGLRPQEAFALTPDDFDFHKNQVVINKAVGYDGDRPYIKPTKTNKVRIVPIPHSFVQDIRLYVESIRTQNMPDVLHHKGNLLSHSQRALFWAGIKKKIEAELHHPTDLHPYIFRHNFCCECYYRGISILKTAELMGNSPTMVMTVYSHLDNSKEPLDRLLDLQLNQN